MFRSVTSSVSAVSGFVAKGHQTMHHVSCSPSKIPYVGFSPVRLQTGIQSQPSQPVGGLSARPACPTVAGRLYVAKAVVSGFYSASLRRGICATWRNPLTSAIQSRGPWLSCGLCCPAGSSLTMASSETLASSRRLIFFVRWVFALRPRMGWMRELPHFAPRVFPFVPPSVPRQTRRLPMAVPSPPAPAFAPFAVARRLHRRARRFPRGRVTRLQSSLYATARKFAGPSPARTSTFELSPPQVTSKKRRI